MRCAGEFGQARLRLEQAGAHGAERTHGDPPSRPAEGTCQGESGQLADDPLRIGRCDRPGHPLRAEPGIGDDGDRTDLQACVERGGEIVPRRHEHGDPVPGLHAEVEQPVRDRRGDVPQVAPRDLLRGVLREVDRRDRLVVPACIEDRRHRTNLRAAVGGTIRGIGGRSLRGGRLGGGVRRVGRIEPGAQPVEDETGNIVIFADEVGGRLESVHIGLRQTLAQVPQVAFEEHRVLRTPDKQRRLVEGGDVLADALEFGIGGMSVVDGDIGDEIADRPPVLCLPVRGVECVLRLGIEIAEAQGHA